MNREEVDAIITLALDRVVERHPDLLELDVTERALCHHLALYLADHAKGVRRRR